MNDNTPGEPDGRKRRGRPPAKASNPDDVLQIDCKPDESMGRAVARSAIRPSVGAAQTIKQAARPSFDLGLQTIIEALREQTDALKVGDLSRFEAMLVTQAHTLDALGHYLARRAMSNAAEGYLNASEIYMRLSLRAFSGCRSHIEALSALKNPPALAIVQQANIGHAVQVNNGVPMPVPSRAPAIAQESPTELLTTNGGRAGMGNLPSDADSVPAFAARQVSNTGSS